jgi:hypothetical protein
VIWDRRQILRENYVSEIGDALTAKMWRKEAYCIQNLAGIPDARLKPGRLTVAGLNGDSTLKGH